jgi:K+-sensing histidine kinase KdpD
MRSRSIVILSILFGYILLQFLWWEILLVKQNNQIIGEKQKLIELSTTDDSRIKTELSELNRKKKMQTIMITGEGTVFLLLLLFGLYKIKQAMDKEQALNNQQKNFFLSITHELKTPIAANKLQLQTLQKQKLDEDMRQGILKSALLENERLNNLIDNILLATRLESNEFLFKLQRLNLSELLQQLVNRYYSKELSAAQLKLNISKDLFIHADEQAFPSIVTNLVSNAFKYASDNALVEISLRAAANQVILEIKDNGPGIPVKEREAVFRKFYRVGNEEVRRSKGTGLGLYIVNYIVKKHQGTITVSDNITGGSVFQLVFNAA